MRIGELAKRARVAPRVIRYYEQQGLLDVDRADNGYREYTDADAERLERVAALVRAGIPTRLVKVLVDAEDAAARKEETCPLEVAELLSEELDGLDERISCLTRSRDTIRTHLARTRTELADREQVG